MGSKYFFRDFVEPQDREPFDEYLVKLLDEKNVPLGDVILKSGMSRILAYDILNGKRSPSRDKTIQLAFGFGLNYDEAQELLFTAFKPQLNAKVKRDAVLIYALNKGYDIYGVQETLSSLRLPILGERERQ